jgi:hypothetical protein
MIFFVGDILFSMSEGFVEIFLGAQSFPDLLKEIMILF